MLKTREPMPVSINTRLCDPNITVVEIAGRLTLGRESEQMESAILGAVNEGATRIVVDMSGVTYLDSSGIGRIAFCFSRMTQKGVHGAIAGAQGLVLEVFRIARIDTMVRIFPDVNTACEALSAGAQSA